MAVNSSVRHADTDLMRLIAALSVVLIHCSSLDTLSGVFYNSAARFSVPVFVLISGSYLLPRTFSVRETARRVAVTLGTALIWSAIYLICDLVQNKLSIHAPIDTVRYLLTEPVHLWYLYALAALYLFTPALQVFYQNADRTQYRYVLMLTFLLGSPLFLLLRSGLLPTLEAVVSRMKMPYTLGFVCLYLAGGYFRKFGLSRRNGSLLGLLALASTAVTFLGTLALRGSELLLSFFAPNVMAAGIGFYAFFRSRAADLPTPQFRALLQILADCTSGVYLLHPLIMKLLPLSLEMLPAPLSIPLHTICIFTISAAAVYLLKKLPVIRRLLL